MVKAGGIDHREDEITKFIKGTLLILFLQLASQFSNLLINLVPNILTLIPVEAHVPCLVLNAVCFYERRKRGWHTRENSFVAIFLLLLHLFPELANLLTGVHMSLPIDMWMAEDEFVGLCVTHVCDIVVSLLRTNYSIEYDVLENISEFLTDFFLVAFHDGIAKFVSLFNGVRTKGVVCLFSVPRTFLSEIVENVQ